jgi:hypothetical protein
MRVDRHSLSIIAWQVQQLARGFQPLAPTTFDLKIHIRHRSKMCIVCERSANHEGVKGGIVVEWLQPSGVATVRAAFELPKQAYCAWSRLPVASSGRRGPQAFWGVGQLGSLGSGANQAPNCAPPTTARSRPPLTCKVCLLRFSRRPALRVSRGRVQSCLALVGNHRSFLLPHTFTIRLSPHRRIQPGSSHELYTGIGASWSTSCYSAPVESDAHTCQTSPEYLRAVDLLSSR